MDSSTKVLLMLGGEWHPFEEFGAYFKGLLESTARYSVTLSEERGDFLADRVREYGIVAAYTQGGLLTEEQEGGLLEFVRGGGSFVGIHCATASWKENRGYIDMIGGVFRAHGPVAIFGVDITDAAAPITEGLAPFEIEDELYLLDRFDPAAVSLLAMTETEDGPQAIAYTKPYGEGKVYYLALGHDNRAFRHPAFRELLLRGFDWAAAPK